MGQQELRLPAAAEQLVQVVGGRRAGAGVDALLEVGVVQQAELAVVDQLVLLALAQRLDGQPELLLGLVHRLVVEIGDPGVDPQHGLRDAQLVLAGRQLVVDERARQRGSPACPAASVDLGLAVFVLLAACRARSRSRWRATPRSARPLVEASRGRVSTVQGVTPWR